MRLGKLTYFTGLLTMLLVSGPLSATAYAQAGSVGGAIGKHDKSASGDSSSESSGPHSRKSKSHRSSANLDNDTPVGKKSRPCTRIAGNWRWVLGTTTTIKANGSATNAGTNTATWTCSNGQYVLVWSNGFIDRATLSDDGNIMSIINNIGFQFSSTRF